MNILRIKTASVGWRRCRNLLLIIGAVTLSACAPARLQLLVEEGNSEALLAMDPDSEQNLSDATRRGKNFCPAGRARDEISVAIPGVGSDIVPASEFSPIRVSPSFDNPLKFRVNAYDPQGVSCIAVNTFRTPEATAAGLETGIRNAAAEFGGTVSEEPCPASVDNDLPPRPPPPETVKYYFDYSNQPDETSRNVTFDYYPMNGVSVVTVIGVEVWDDRDDMTSLGTAVIAPDSLLCEAR